MRESGKKYLQAVVKRLCDTSEDHRLNDRYCLRRPSTFSVFAVQAPIMLLTLCANAFLVGLCSVIFALLVIQPVWGDNAKVYTDTQLLFHVTLKHGHRSQSRSV